MTPAREYVRLSSLTKRQVRLESLTYLVHNQGLHRPRSAGAETVVSVWFHNRGPVDQV